MNSSIAANTPQIRYQAPIFRSPSPEDGAAVHRLIADCPPLDPNSRYCNLLQCSHFSDTSIIAEIGPVIVAFISGYILPKNENTLFIWQVAVADSARRQNIATQMLLKLLLRPVCRNVRYLESTVTDANIASKTLFTKLAGNLGVPLKTSPLFTCDIHFDGQHSDEILYKIGPFSTSLLTITT